MVQHLGEAEAAALTETATQVSSKQRIVIKVHFPGSLFRISMRGLVTSALCPLQLWASRDEASWLGLNNKVQVEGRSAKNLQKRCGWGRMCVCSRVHAHVHKRDCRLDFPWLWTLWVQIPTQHRSLSFCRPFTSYPDWLVLSPFAMQVLSGNTQEIWEFEGKIWTISGLGRSTRERCRLLLFSNL